MKRDARRLLGPVAALALLTGACAGGPSLEAGREELVRLEGDVFTLRDGHWDPVTDPRTISPGDEVRVEDGRARLDLASGQALELAPGTRLRVGGAHQVLSGSVLARSTAEVRVRVDEVEVSSSDSVFRVDRGLSTRVAVYEGAASAPGSGWAAPIGALEQLIIVGNAAPQAPVPLQVDTRDPWDARLLGDAIDVGVRLLSQQTGLEAQLRGAVGRDAVLGTLAGLLPRSSLRALLASGSAAEVVVASILAVTVRGDGAGRLLREILAFRELGASWIVVAGRWGIERTALGALAETIVRILSFSDRDTAASAPGRRGPSATTAVSRGGRGGGGSSGRGPGSSSPDSSAPGPPSSSGPSAPTGSAPAPPPEPPPPPPPPPCSDPVACIVDDLVGGLPPIG